MDWDGLNWLGEVLGAFPIKSRLQETEKLRKIFEILDFGAKFKNLDFGAKIQIPNQFKNLKKWEAEKNIWNSSFLARNSKIRNLGSKSQIFENLDFGAKIQISNQIKNF